MYIHPSQSEPFGGLQVTLFPPCLLSQELTLTFLSRPEHDPFVDNRALERQLLSTDFSPSFEEAMNNEASYASSFVQVTMFAC